MLAHAGRVAVYPGPQAIQRPSHSYGAYWAAAPLESLDKNQLSSSHHAGPGKLAHLVALCVMSDHVCAPLAYLSMLFFLNAKNGVLSADLSIPEA